MTPVIYLSSADCHHSSNDPCRCCMPLGRLVGNMARFSEGEIDIVASVSNFFEFELERDKRLHLRDVVKRTAAVCAVSSSTVRGLQGNRGRREVTTGCEAKDRDRRAHKISHPQHCSLFFFEKVFPPSTKSSPGARQTSMASFRWDAQHSPSSCTPLGFSFENVKAPGVQ